MGRGAARPISLILNVLFLKFTEVTLVKNSTEVSSVRFHVHHLDIASCAHHPKSSPSVSMNLTPLRPRQAPPLACRHHHALVACV